MPPPTSERSLLLPAGDRGAARAELALDLRFHLRLQRLHLVELAAAQRALDAVQVVARVRGRGRGRLRVRVRVRDRGRVRVRVRGRGRGRVRVRVRVRGPYP